MAKGYKVVSIHEGRFCSCRVRPTREQKVYANATHFYDLNIPTTPRPGYGALAVFPTLKEARRFANSSYMDMEKNERIFKCYYRPSRTKELEIPFYRKTKIGDWEGIPNSTKFASSVVLLKEVK